MKITKNIIGLVFILTLLTGCASNQELISLLAPAKGNITQRFSEEHQGLDFAPLSDSIDAKVFAAQSGEVISAETESDDEYGQNVLIDHGNGYQTFYAHLGSINIKAGDKVEQGQEIGTVGKSGETFGEPGYVLHFELRQGDKSIDPSSYFLSN